MTKRILGVLVVLLLAGTIGLVAGCGGGLSNDAVAKVGSKVFTQQDLDQRVAGFEAQYPGQIPDKTSDPDNYKLFQQDVVEFMITFELATQYASANGITVTDEDVQKQIDTIKEQSFGGDQAKFDEGLKQQGFTLDQLKASIKENTLLQKVYEDVTKDVTTVPDSEIQKYYDAHKSSYFVEETRTARHILIAPDAGRVDGTTSTTSTSSTTSTTVGSTDSSTGSSDSSSTTASTPTASSSTTTTPAPTEADWNAALATANKVRTQLLGGADWTVEAKTYSDDPGSKETGGELRTTGGELRTIKKGDMVKEFEDSAFSLKKDEISQPIKTAYGYHIIQVTGINEAKQYTLDEVKEEIKSSVLASTKSEAWRKWIEAQKTTANVTYGNNWVPTTTTSTTSAFPTTTAPASGSTDTTATVGSTTTTAKP